MGGAWCRAAGVMDRDCDRLFCLVGERTTRATGAYCAIVCLATVVTAVLRAWSVGYFQASPLIAECVCRTCYEDQIVLRMSFGMTLGFALLATVVNLSPNCVALAAYYDWWFLKFVAAGSLCFTAFFLPNIVFRGFAYVAAGLAGLFVIMQAVTLLDFSYTWNEIWRGSEPPYLMTGWRWALLVASGLMLGGTLVLGGFMFTWFPCPLGLSANTAAVASAVLSTAFGVMCTEHASLLTGAVVAINVQVTTLSGLRSQAGCNALSGATMSVLLGLILAAAAVTRAAWATIRDGDHSLGVRARGAVLELRRPKRADDQPGAVADEPSFCYCWGGEPLPERGAGVYLLVLTTAMAYMGMVLSSWGVNLTDDCTGDTTRNTTGLWVNLGVAWLIIVAFAWSLVAPRVLSDRQF